MGKQGCELPIKKKAEESAAERFNEVGVHAIDPLLTWRWFERVKRNPLYHFTLCSLTKNIIFTRPWVGQQVIGTYSFSKQGWTEPSFPLEPSRQIAEKFKIQVQPRLQDDCTFVIPGIKNEYVGKYLVAEDAGGCLLSISSSNHRKRPQLPRITKGYDILSNWWEALN